MSKLATLMLITALVLSSLVMVGSAFAESISKPSVPEFTVELADSSYDVPTTYEVDPYTGENMTHEGYHLVSTSIQVKIKNQPFTPYEIQDSNGNNWTANFFYNIRIKGRFTEDWIELYRASDGYPTQSGSQYTIRSYVLGGDADTVLGTKMIKLPADAQVDFQVEAMIGYVHREIIIAVPGSGWIFTGETSGWSNTQTITITESHMPTSSPYNEPQIAEQEVILGAAITVAVLGAGLGLLLYLIKRK